MFRGEMARSGPRAPLWGPSYSELLVECENLRSEGFRARTEARDLGRDLEKAKERIAALETANSLLQKHLQQRQQQQNQPQHSDPEQQQQQQHRRLSREEVARIVEQQKKQARERASASRSSRPVSPHQGDPEEKRMKMTAEPPEDQGRARPSVAPKYLG